MTSFHTHLVPIRDFLKRETAGGIMLIIAAVIALLLANSPLGHYYQQLINLPVIVGVGDMQLAKPLLLWINDGLMAVFFFVVGLELKREVLTGELSDTRTIILPAIGALGGMIVPAGIYAAINWGDAIAMNGWAVPVATDIAFALAILLLLGSRVPTALKVFLVSLAIFDDIGAIIIIALFYTSDMSSTALLISLACLIILALLNRFKVVHISAYVLVGTIMWVAVLKSGVHATLAGIALAMFIPHSDPSDPDRSPLRELEHDLHGTIAFLILPLFAFANSGVSLAGFNADQLLHPVPLGIAVGLLFGKQIGVFSFCWLAVKTGVARLPDNIQWMQLYGVSLLCGIGFTMSLFIGSLSFEDTGVNLLFDERIGIIIGSVISAIAGFIVLRRNI